MPLQQLEVITATDEIHSEEEALNYARQQVELAAGAKRAMTFAVLAVEQRRLFQILMMRYGCAMGALAALRLCRKLSDEAYQALRQEAMDLLAPKIAG